MTDDLKARLDALHVWPQAVADAYAAELTPRQIDKLYAVGKVATEAADRIATLEAALDKANSEADFFKSEVKLRNRIPSTNDTAADLLRRAEKAEAALADMTQQRDAAMAGAVKGKTLVWVKHPSVDIWRADTAFGTYKVFGLGPTQSWDFDSFSDLNDKTSKSAESVTAAKAAAQADYETRARSMWQPDPDRMLALTAAAEAQAEARGMRICADIYYTRCCADDDGDDVYREMTASADATEAAAKGGV